MSPLFTLLLVAFAVAYLTAIIAGAVPAWLKRAVESRRAAWRRRAESEVADAQREELRARIIGGADFLDRSNAEREVAA